MFTIIFFLKWEIVCKMPPFCCGGEVFFFCPQKQNTVHIKREVESANDNILTYTAQRVWPQISQVERWASRTSMERGRFARYNEKALRHLSFVLLNLVWISVDTPRMNYT